MNSRLRILPYVLCGILLALKLSFFQIYPEDFHYAAPMGLKWNVDAQGWIACSGTFPEKFIEQTLCGYYNLLRPGYAFLISVFALPMTWISAFLVPDSFWGTVGVKLEEVPFAIAAGTSIFLNLLLAWLVVYCIGRLFKNFFSDPNLPWLLQMTYVTSYGFQAQIAHPVPEIAQQLVMIGIPLITYEGLKKKTLPLYLFGFTVKELVSVYGASLVTRWRERSLKVRDFSFPLLLLAWLAVMHFGYSVPIRSHNVDDYDYGVWFLPFFSDPVGVSILFFKAWGYILRAFFLSMIPVLPLSILGFFVLKQPMPRIVFWNLLFSVLQLLAMGWSNPRISFNFFFFPTLFLFAVVVERFVPESVRLRLGFGIAGVGLILGCFNIQNWG